MIKICETCKIKFKGKPKRKFCSRQKEIKEFFPDFNFIRIREKFYSF